jgi:FkbM family methyltransferase
MIARMARLLRHVADAGRPEPPAPVRYGAYLGGHRFLTTTAHGQKIYLDTRDVTLTPHVILGGAWEPAVTDRVLACVRPGMRAVEVGCNQGWYTLLVAQQVGPEGRVIAFEANPDLVALVADSASVNGYPWRVTVHNLAVSDASGEATFHIRERHLGNSTLGNTPQPVLDHLHEAVREVRVRTAALDHFLAGPDRRIDFLKIDAEGSEPAVFRGMERLLRENDRIVIVMEYSPVQMNCAGHDPAEAMAFLAGLGFGMHRIEDTGGLTRLTADGLRGIENCDLLLTRYDPPGP